MKYLYQIAGISVLCEIPFPIQIREESSDFIQKIEKKVDYDLIIYFKPISRFEKKIANGYWDIDRCHIGRKVYYCEKPHGRPYARITNKFCDSKGLICEYIYGKESFINYSHNICDIIALDSLLLNHQGILLHSSFIRWKEKGLLFSAPSGTGKSTQADLWVKYEGAEIINGDRAGLRKLDNGWTAYGLPYAGSSGVYRNESAPVTAIIVLRQAEGNRIRPLGPVEAVQYLYPEITVHQWDKDFVNRVMDLLMDLVFNVPIYLLECLPDQGAVELVRKTIL